MFEFSGTFINPQSAIYYSGIEVPSAIIEEIKKLENKRFIVHINDLVEYPGTPVPIEKGIYIILVNKTRAKKLKLVIGQKVQVKLIQDNSKYGMPLPDEFKEVLDEDPEGKALLEGLTPGKIRNLIYLVTKVKNPEKRIEKAVIILEHLRINNGKLDNKMLNMAFKEYNQR
jgi:hypothetical protein